MPAPFAAELQAAHSEALSRLLQLMRESDSETQIRLAAAAILRIRIPNEPEPITQPARAAHPARPKAAPLSPAELADLTRLLPTVKPNRFTTKHTPNHWRAVLAERRRDSELPIRSAA